MKRWINLTMILSLFSLMTSCFQSEYEQMVKKEMSKGERMDSLFFGIKFGDTDKDFFGQCWELNKAGIISHGPKNMNVQYDIKMEEGSDIMMLFYPEFDKDKKIKRMDLEFSFKARSPWNNEYTATNLLPIVTDTLMSWFPGNSFVKVEFDDDKGGIKEAWAKVDGNRRISMNAESKDLLLVRIVDMLNGK